MSTHPTRTGISVPPPAYSEAVNYPTTAFSGVHVSHSNTLFTEGYGPTGVDFQNGYCILPPGNVALFKCVHQYDIVPPLNSLVKIRYIHTYPNKGIIEPLLIVEAAPQTLASPVEHMGVKTYSQLEVNPVDDNPTNQHKLGDRSRGMCAEEGVNSFEAIADRLGSGGGTHCNSHGNHEPIHSNCKGFIVPVNGMVGQDRMIVESLLSDVNNDSYTLNESLDDLPSPPSEIYDYGENVDIDSQTEHDRESVLQALESEPKTLLDEPSLRPINAFENDELSETFNDTNHRDATAEVTTPLLPVTNAQCNGPKQGVEIPTTNHRHDNDTEYADSGYSDCNRLEFKEHVIEFNTDHVVEKVIYSESEHLCSDISTKGMELSPRQAKDKCQRTLKRTNNDHDHTVYELSPSESFCTTGGDMSGPAGDNLNASIASSEGICRIGRSTSSCVEGSKGKSPFTRQSSVSFTKPLIVGKGEQRATDEMQPNDPDADTEDGEPLVSPIIKNSTSSIPSHLLLEDTRTYYRRKAADRGTLYCACGGIAVVATIVFLLIYFS